MLKDIFHPKNSSIIIQHNEVLQRMISAYNNNKLHHAYIFTGIKGIGKATLAYIFTKLILSNNTYNNEYYNSIISSNDINLINNNCHPNLLVIEPEFDEKLEQYKSTITIEQTRNIKAFLNVTSINSDIYPKIVIIDAIDNLNINAANSILKLLEEPCSNGIFFLICHNLSNILPTIISRCIITKFKPLNKEQIYKIIETLNLDQDTLKKIKDLNLEDVSSMQDIIWFLDNNNYKIYKLAQEILLYKDISKLSLLSDSVKNLNSYNFKYLIELITPKEFSNKFKQKFLDNEFLNIKLLLEQDRLFTLDKTTILISYILKLISS